MSDKLTVLIVDDSRVIRKACSKILTESYDLIEAENGEEGWDILNENSHICAVFSDINMPVMGGIELVQKMRTDINPHLQKLPVILLTGDNDDDEVRQRALAAGATDFITKPFNSIELTARAQAHVKELSPQGERGDLATLDPVTKLGNKQFFLAHGEELISYANRHKSLISLVLVQIDGYNSFVQKHADDPGLIENLIITVGSFIAAEVRREDNVARLDRSLYGMLLPGTDAYGAAQAALRIQKKLAEQSFRAGKDNVQVTLSIGIACPAGEKARNVAMLVQEAKEQLVAAKANSNCIRPDPATLQPPQAASIGSLDECLAKVSNDHSEIDAEQLLLKLQPLLAYCDQKLELKLPGKLTGKS